jgi:hypothetical protein
MLLNINFEVGNQLGDPLIKIIIDDYLVLYEGVAIQNFERQFDIPAGNHELKIVHYGKQDSDHVLNNDGSIKIDKFVNISSITIDKVKLKDSELQEGKFWPVYSSSYVKTTTEQNYSLPLYISPNLYLGHNGTWCWNFYYPFVDWIIEKRKNGPDLENTIFKTSEHTLLTAKNFFNNIDEI